MKGTDGHYTTEGREKNTTAQNRQVLGKGNLVNLDEFKTPGPDVVHPMF